MKLTDSPGQTIDSVCYSIYSSTSIQLDGQNKGEWNNAPRYAISNEFMSGITGPEDQSGSFRVKWDDQNLYFFVEIQDDVKRLIDKTGDYGWITDTNQDTIWFQTEDITLPAGSDPSIGFVNVNIPVKTGDYILHYQTNQSNSFGRWTKDRPQMSFYGIVIYGNETNTNSEEQDVELAANKDN